MCALGRVQAAIAEMSTAVAQPHLRADHVLAATLTFTETRGGTPDPPEAAQPAWYLPLGGLGSPRPIKLIERKNSSAFTVVLFPQEVHEDTVKCVMLMFMSSLPELRLHKSGLNQTRELLVLRGKL